MADSINQTLGINTGFRYDSNPLYSVTNSQSAWTATFAPTYTVDTDIGQNELSLTAGLNVQRSSNVYVLVNRNDPTATLNWTRILQNGTLTVTAHYEQDSTLFGVSQAGNNLIAEDGTRSLQTLSADWLDNLSDTWQIDNNINTSDVTYNFNNLGNNNLAALMSNYQTTVYSSKISKTMSDTLSAFGQIAYTQFSLDSQPVSENQVSAVLGLQSQLSQSLNLLVDAGAVNSSGSSYTPIGGIPSSSASSIGAIGTATLTYQGLRSSGTLLASRTNLPSGFGGFLVTDRISGQYSYDLSDKNSIGAGYSYFKNTTLFIESGNQANIWFNRQITTALGLKLMLLQNSFSAPGFPATADNAVSLFLTYNNPDF